METILILSGMIFGMVAIIKWNCSGSDLTGCGKEIKQEQNPTVKYYRQSSPDENGVHQLD